MLPSPEDHVAISHLLARYCLSLDLDDVDGWVSLFTPDASYEAHGRAFRGHEGLPTMMGAAPQAEDAPEAEPQVPQRGRPQPATRRH